jgi:hypothetical protein
MGDSPRRRCHYRPDLSVLSQSASNDSSIAREDHPEDLRTDSVLISFHIDDDNAQLILTMYCSF